MNVGLKGMTWLKDNGVNLDFIKLLGTCIVQRDEKDCGGLVVEMVSSGDRHCVRCEDIQGQYEYKVDVHERMRRQEDYMVLRKEREKEKKEKKRRMG